MPDRWFFSALPRFFENVLPWILAADLRALFFNVERSNDANGRAIAEGVIAQDPDVVVFAEAHPMRLARDLLKAHYAFAPDCPQGGLRHAGLCA